MGHVLSYTVLPSVPPHCLVPTTCWGWHPLPDLFQGALCLSASWFRGAPCSLRFGCPRGVPPLPSWPGYPVPYLPLGHGTHGTGHGSEHQARPTLAGLAEERPSEAQCPFVTA